MSNIVLVIDSDSLVCKLTYLVNFGVSCIKNILVEDAAKYTGQYVTTADFGKTKVISASTNALEAYYAAVSKGYIEPVLIYVPNEGE